MADPENRLVTGELEHRWNEALERVSEVESELAALASDPITLSEGQRHGLLSLGQDLRALWHHPSATDPLKKRILRTVLHEIIIESTSEPPEHLLQLHWQGGIHTELRVARNGVGKHRRTTEVDVIKVITELSKVCRDATIAATLNRLGYRTGTGKTWRAHSVANVRYRYRLPNFPKDKDWLTLKQSAQQLGVSATVVTRLIAQGSLPATQIVPQAPWIIKRIDLDLKVVRAEIEAVKSGRRRSRCRCEQPELPLAPFGQAGEEQAVSGFPETLCSETTPGDQ